MNKPKPQFGWVLLIVFVSMILVYELPARTQKPPRPGKHYVWIPPVKLKNGRITPGYWKYIPPPQKRKIWFPGREAANGEWIPGHYKYAYPPSPDAVWVPGHENSNGRWVRGHWEVKTD